MSGHGTALLAWQPPPLEDDGLPAAGAVQIPPPSAAAATRRNTQLRREVNASVLKRVIIIKPEKLTERFDWQPSHGTPRMTITVDGAPLSVEEGAEEGSGGGTAAAAAPRRAGAHATVMEFNKMGRDGFPFKVRWVAKLLQALDARLGDTLLLQYSHTDSEGVIHAAASLERRAAPKSGPPSAEPPYTPSATANPTAGANADFPQHSLASDAATGAGGGADADSGAGPGPEAKRRRVTPAPPDEQLLQVLQRAEAAVGAGSQEGQAAEAVVPAVPEAQAAPAEAAPEVEAAAALPAAGQADDLACPHCGKPYVYRRALERHAAKCKARVAELTSWDPVLQRGASKAGGARTTASEAPDAAMDDLATVLMTMRQQGPAAGPPPAFIGAGEARAAEPARAQRMQSEPLAERGRHGAILRGHASRSVSPVDRGALLPSAPFRGAFGEHHQQAPASPVAAGGPATEPAAAPAEMHQESAADQQAAPPPPHQEAARAAAQQESAAGREAAAAPPPLPEPYPPLHVVRRQLKSFNVPPEATQRFMAVWEAMPPEAQKRQWTGNLKELIGGTEQEMLDYVHAMIMD